MAQTANRPQEKCKSGRPFMTHVIHRRRITRQWSSSNGRDETHHLYSESSSSMTFSTSPSKNQSIEQPMEFFLLMRLWLIYLVQCCLRPFLTPFYGDPFGYSQKQTQTNTRPPSKKMDGESCSSEPERKEGETNLITKPCAPPPKKKNIFDLEGRNGQTMPSTTKGATIPVTTTTITTHEETNVYEGGNSSSSSSSSSSVSSPSASDSETEAPFSRWDQGLCFGARSEQGIRKRMEDSHRYFPHFEELISQHFAKFGDLFDSIEHRFKHRWVGCALFDGHLGSSAAEFCTSQLIQIIAECISCHPCNPIHNQMREKIPDGGYTIPVNSNQDILDGLKADDQWHTFCEQTDHGNEPGFDEKKKDDDDDDENDGPIHETPKRLEPKTKRYRPMTAPSGYKSESRLFNHQCTPGILPKKRDESRPPGDCPSGITPKKDDFICDALRIAFRIGDEVWRRIAIKNTDKLDESGAVGVFTLLDSHTKHMYVANLGDVQGIICRDGRPHKVTHEHSLDDPIELKRIWDEGGFICGSGREKLLNGEVGVPRAIGDYRYATNIAKFNHQRDRAIAKRDGRFRPTRLNFHDSSVTPEGSSSSISSNPIYPHPSNLSTDNLHKSHLIKLHENGCKPMGMSCEAYVAKIEMIPKDQFMILACDGVWDVTNDSRVAMDSRKIWRKEAETAKKLRKSSINLNQDRYECIQRAAQSVAHNVIATAMPLSTDNCSVMVLGFADKCAKSGDLIVVPPLPPLKRPPSRRRRFFCSRKITTTTKDGHSTITQSSSLLCLRSVQSLSRMESDPMLMGPLTTRTNSISSEPGGKSMSRVKTNPTESDEDERDDLLSSLPEKRTSHHRHSSDLRGRFTWSMRAERRMASND